MYSKIVFVHFSCLVALKVSRAKIPQKYKIFSMTNTISQRTDQTHLNFSFSSSKGVEGGLDVVFLVVNLEICVDLCALVHCFICVFK